MWGIVLNSFGTGEDFLNITIAEALRTMNNSDLEKLKSFCMVNDTIIWKKQQLTEWEKFFSNYTSDKELMSKIYKELKKKTGHQENKKPNLKMWYRSPEYPFSKEDTQMAEDPSKNVQHYQSLGKGKSI